MSEKKRSITQSPWFKIGLILLILLSGILIITFTPIGAYLTDIKQVRADIESAGIWGVIIFITIFVITALFNIPETGFIIMAFLIYDNIFFAASLNYVAGLLSAIATFYAGRLIGSGALSEIKSVRVKKLIASAENNPIKTLVIIRTIMIMNPIVGYALALTKISPRNYIIGNAVGIIVPVLYISLGMYFVKDSIMKFFGIDL
jgi:uncharacterized membrane protein YdjX (TVP38/TMEM64 family)